LPEAYLFANILPTACKGCLPIHEVKCYNTINNVLVILPKGGKCSVRIFAIDDEQLMLNELCGAIAEAEPRAEILDFKNAEDVLEAINGGVIPDVVFSDIRLPGIDGLHLAVRIKELAPEARIVLVTAYSQYALEAYRRHVNGYVLKPVDAAAIREELDHLPKLPEPEPDKLQVQCFGRFEVFWHGEPLRFERRQTKELLAFLIDKEGASCTAEEIAAALWERDTNMRAVKANIRLLLSDLKKTLRSVGMSDALIRSSGQAAIRRGRVDCDYFHMLEGDTASINLFHGEYMSQYSWAELTEGRLHFLIR